MWILLLYAPPAKALPKLKELHIAFLRNFLYKAAFLFLYLLQIKVEDKIFPCHSSILGLHSNVLSDMFASDPKPENWSKGVTAAFNGSKPDVVQLYLCQTYKPAFRIDMLFRHIVVLGTPIRTTHDVIFETMELAHKLDNSHLQTVRFFFRHLVN